MTAVCCYTGMVAIGVQRAASAPNTVSVTGFDDTEPGRYVTPPLTTIRRPKRELGRRAMRTRLDLGDGRDVEDQVPRPSILVRESTRPVHEDG